jgi:hypothetical protein
MNLSILIVCIILLFKQLSDAAAIPSPFATNLLISKVKTTSQRFQNGFKILFDDFKKTIDIRRKGRKGNISFSEYLLVEKSTEDMWKLARLVLMAALAREFFIYAYVLGPVISNSVNAWNSWPSTFESDVDKIRREKALTEKKLQALTRLVHTLNSETYSDLTEDQVVQAKRKLASLMKALKAPNAAAALTEIEDFYYTEKSPKPKQSFSLKSCPGMLAKEILNSFGTEGLPNIILINRLNVNEIGNYLTKV